MDDQVSSGLAPWTTHPDVLARPAWSVRRRVVSWLWAFTPLITMGLANAMVFLYAAVRRRTPLWWLAFVAYTALLVTIFALTDPPEGSARDAVYTSLLMTNLVVGAGHALATRSRVFQPDPVLALGDDPVLARALEAQERRDLARRILAQDPRLAGDLCIGRPDLGRGYDDGGLVDVNTAPLPVVAQVTGLAADAVQRIGAARDAAGGFTSLEELAVLADLSPALVDRVRDRVVLSPR